MCMTIILHSISQTSQLLPDPPSPPVSDKLPESIKFNSRTTCTIALFPSSPALESWRWGEPDIFLMWAWCNRGKKRPEHFLYSVVHHVKVEKRRHSGELEEEKVIWITWAVSQANCSGFSMEQKRFLRTMERNSFIGFHKDLWLAT